MSALPDYRVRARLIAGKWHWELLDGARVVNWGPSGFDTQGEAEEVGETFRQWKLDVEKRRAERKAKRRKPPPRWYMRYRGNWQDHVDRRAGE